MGACKPVLLGLRKAVPRLLVVDAFEGKIVAEDEPVARARRAGESAFNGLAHAEGRGALAGRLGERVAAPTINLSDSPRYPRTLPRAFGGI